MAKVCIIGYSGHAYVVNEAIYEMGHEIEGYFDVEEKPNPFHLRYLGKETDEMARTILSKNRVVVAIGDNAIREKIMLPLLDKQYDLLTVIHPGATVSKSATIGNGTVILAASVINALAHIGEGVICNTSSVIEHECEISDYAHIAPGAVLAGNVKIGKRTFVGANAIIRQGLVIGDDVVIGAGAVVVKDIGHGSKVYGNPGRNIE